MSENIKQRYNASTQTTTSNPFRNIDLSDGTPAIDGDVIVFGGVCDTAGAAVDFATQTTLAAIAVDAAAIEVLLGTIDADTGAIATSAASIDTKTPALGQALAAASVPVVLTAAQISTLTPPAAITGFATESTLGALSAKFASGTVIGDVNLGATDHAELDAIAASVAAIDAGQLADGHNVTVSGSVTANIGTVGTLATAAKQDTGNTSLATLAGAVAGTEVQVDIVTMPNVTIAGTVTVGSHAVTNAGTFVVQVDGAALTSLQLLDDSVATTGSAITSKGMAAVGTDGTNARILKTDAAGELQIDVLTLPALAAGTNNIGDVDVLSLPALPTGTNSIGQVTANAGTNLNTSALALESGGNLAAISGATYVSNGTLARIVGLGAWDANDSGTMKALTCDVNGLLFVSIANQSPVEMTFSAVSTHDSAAPLTPVLIGGYASATAPTDVTAADAVRAWHLLNGSPVVNLAVGGTLVTGSAGLPVAGGVAHDSADSGNPNKIGGKATTSLATATLVAGADRVDTAHDLDGAIIVRHGAPLGDNKSTSQSVTNTTSTAATNFGAVASTKNVITEITVYNSSATPTFVKIQDGSGGTTFWNCPAPAGGGSVVQFSRGLKQPTANTALYFAANDAASTVYVSINGYQSKV